MQALTAEALISELGQSIGIAGLRADAQGCCRLLFDGNAIVEIRHVPAQGRWLLSCALASQAPGLEGLKLLLRGNWLGSGFGGGWAGLDEQGNAVLHLPLADAEASASALLVATELLLSHAERWTKRLDEGPRSAQGMAGPMGMWAQRI